MEGERSKRGGWWVLILSTLLVLALAVVAAGRWALAEEGLINGERASVYVDRLSNELGVRAPTFHATSQPGTVPSADAKGLLTLLRMADGKPTQLEALLEKLRGILPKKFAARLPAPKSGNRATIACSLVMASVNRDRAGGPNSILGTLTILPEAEAVELGPIVMGIGRPMTNDAPQLASALKRFLASSDPNVNEFAVALQIDPALAQLPTDPHWFAAAKKAVGTGTNFDNNWWLMPGYLRRKNVPDNLAKPVLEELSQGRALFARVEAKIELWRRNPGTETVEAFIRRTTSEEGIVGLDRCVDYFRAGQDQGSRPPLAAVKELIAQLPPARQFLGKTPFSFQPPRPARTRQAPAALFVYGSYFDRVAGLDSSTLAQRAVSLARGMEKELQPQAGDLLAVLKDKKFSAKDRMAVADLLQRLPTEPPEILGLLGSGFQDGSLGIAALPLLGKYGPKILEHVPGARALLDSNDRTERPLAAGFFKRATPAHPALLDRWIMGLRDPAIQSIAAEALGDYGPAAAKAAPVLAEMIEDESRATGIRELRIAAIAALGKIRPGYDVVISAALMVALKDQPGARLHEELVSAAKAAILELAPAGHPDRLAAAQSP